MAAHTRKKKQPGRKNLVILLLVIVILAVISIVAGWYFTNRHPDDTSGDNGSQVVRKGLSEEVKTPLEGTWVSEYDGAILTISRLSFSLELPSVDKQVIIAGTIRTYEQTVVLKNISANAICKGIEGKYQYTIKDGKLFLKLLSDECRQRKERMSAAWFRL